MPVAGWGIRQARKKRRALATADEEVAFVGDRAGGQPAAAA